MGHLRTLEIVWLLGEQPEEGLTQLLTDDQRAFSRLAALLRNSACLTSSVSILVCICVCFSKPLCLSSESEGL